MTPSLSVMKHSLQFGRMWIVKQKVIKRPIIIAWQQQYSVGNDALDADHKHLLHLINSFYVSSKSIKHEDLEHTLSALTAYSIKHFYNEESHMRKILYHGITKHQALHEAFIAKVQGFHNTLRNNRHLELGVEVAKFLASWWKNHIIVEDQLYAKTKTAAR